VGELSAKLTEGALSLDRGEDRNRGSAFGVLELDLDLLADGQLGQVAVHEIGQDDGSTSPASPINCFIESTPMEIGEGESFGFAWRMIPDVTFRNSAAANPKLDFVLLAQDFSGSNFSQEKSNNTTLVARLPIEQFTDQTYFRYLLHFPIGKMFWAFHKKICRALEKKESSNTF
jgi:hypothetical protein